jgi:putative ABC transport system permease protein
MFTYHLRLAFKSLRRNPVLSALMIGAIALGVGVCSTTLTVYRLMSGNPIAHRNDVLYAVTVDNWDPARPWNEKRPDIAPMEIAYRDAMALGASKIPSRHVVMRKTTFVVDPSHANGAKPFQVEARLATKDFFTMFDTPFLYGGGWDQAADDGAQNVVVLTRNTNQKTFGDVNSVGRTLQLDGRDYKVVGVLNEWNPSPKFYDLNNGAFDEPEELFVPLSVGAALELPPAGNVNCWRNEPLNSYTDLMNSDCVWHQFWVQLDNDEQVQSYRTFVDNYVRDQKALGRFPRPMNNHLYRPDEWLKHNRVVRDDNRVLVGLSFMFLAVCLLNMLGLLLAKFLGGAPLVGLRRALGASRSMIFRQHLVEVSVIGVAGGLLGVGLTILGLLQIRTMYENYEGLTRVDFTMVILAIAIALAAGVIAGLYPTWRVCRTQPASYLKTQ